MIIKQRPSITCCFICLIFDNKLWDKFYVYSYVELFTHLINE